MNSLRHQLAHRGIVLWASKYNGSCQCFCIVQWLWYRALPVWKEPHKDSIIRSCRLGTLAAGYIFVSIGNFMCVGEMVSSNSCLFLFVRVLFCGWRGACLALLSRKLLQGNDHVAVRPLVSSCSKAPVQLTSHIFFYLILIFHPPADG